MVSALAGELIEQITGAFRKVRYPGDANLIGHPCDECFQLQRDFSGQVPRTMSRDIIDKHHSDLPLLTDEAKQFFLPAFLIASIRQPESPVTEFVIYQLDTDHRWTPSDGYTPAQRAAIRSYLDYIEMLLDGQHTEDIASAREKWSKTV
jgi:hypothetical protein